MMILLMTTIKKMIGTRRTTSMTIANNKRKYHLVTIDNGFTGI